MNRFKSEIDDINILRINPGERFSMMQGIYERQIAPLKPRLAGLNDSLVHDIFHATSIVASYSIISNPSRTERYIDDLKFEFDALETRNIASQAECQRMYQIFILGRQFEAARRFKSASLGLDAPPAPIVRDGKSFDPGKPSAYALLDASTGSLELRSVDFNPSIQVVVVGGCHFANDAMHDIQSNAALRDALDKANAIWISPYDGMLGLDALQDFNRRYPERPMLIAYDYEKWSPVEFWIMPKFFFFKHGKLLGTESGWRAGHVSTSLIAMLVRMNLLDSGKWHDTHDHASDGYFDLSNQS